VIGPNNRGNSQPSCFDRIWESESILSEDHLSGLNRQLQLMHDNSSPKLLNLIDPCLYPVIYNVTYGDGGTPGKLLPPDVTQSNMLISDRKFAYLPTDVQISSSNEARFLSYINNIHLSDKDLYKFLECSLSAFIPLFERTLTDLHRNNLSNLRIPDPCKYITWEEPEPPEFSDDEEGWTNYQREMSTWTMSRPLALPDVSAEGYPGGLEKRKHVVSLQNRRIQVVVKCSDVKLASMTGFHVHVYSELLFRDQVTLPVRTRQKIGVSRD
jgi:hypothetical protein